MTAIEWTDATWNPVTGCTKVSPGCAHCYIERQTPMRIAGRRFERGRIELQLHRERLERPLHWRKPRRVFVNSMSDVFHEDVPAAFIAEMFEVMAAAEWHSFQVLTKRPERMVELAPSLPWPGNVWLGVTIENRRFVDRANLLRRVPAAVRFISAEPLLGPLQGLDLDGIDWLIVGGESGAEHRPMRAEWARELRDRCLAEGVAFFFKQWGGQRPKDGGRLLDGRTWDRLPEARCPMTARTGVGADSAGDQLRLFAPPRAYGDPHCIDCDVDTLAIREYYALRDEVWPLPADEAAMLCIACAERRLGRRLEPADFTDVPINLYGSERMMSRRRHPRSRRRRVEEAPTP